MKKIVFNITPIGKPRMVHSDKWSDRTCVNNYWLYKDELNILANIKGYKITDTLQIIFYLPFPKSWSLKKMKKLEGQPHRQKPDLDNLLKAFTDCLTNDDSGLWNVNISKLWSKTGKIEIFN